MDFSCFMKGREKIESEKTEKETDESTTDMMVEENKHAAIEEETGDGETITIAQLLARNPQEPSSQPNKCSKGSFEKEISNKIKVLSRHCKFLEEKTNLLQNIINQERCRRTVLKHVKSNRDCNKLKKVWKERGLLLDDEVLQSVKASSNDAFDMKSLLESLPSTSQTPAQIQDENAVNAFIEELRTLHFQIRARNAEFLASYSEESKVPSCSRKDGRSTSVADCILRCASRNMRNIDRTSSRSSARHVPVSDWQRRAENYKQTMEITKIQTGNKEDTFWRSRYIATSKNESSKMGCYRFCCRQIAMKPPRFSRTCQNIRYGRSQSIGCSVQRRYEDGVKNFQGLNLRDGRRSKLPMSIQQINNILSHANSQVNKANSSRDGMDLEEMSKVEAVAKGETSHQKDLSIDIRESELKETSPKTNREPAKNLDASRQNLRKLLDLAFVSFRQNRAEPALPPKK